MTDKTEIMGTELSYSQVRTRVRRNLIAQAELANVGDVETLNVPCVMGPVGAGKSSMAAAEALDFGLDLLTINSGENSDPTDVSGMPVPDLIRTLMVDGTQGEKTEASGRYMEWVLNRYAAEACARPVALFIDDIDKAPPPVQNGLLGIFGTRRFRNEMIHPHTLLMSAGNRTGDDRTANELSESLRTRVTVLEMRPDVLSFTHYGSTTGRVHGAVLGFLNYKPEHLYRHTDGVARFPTPRGWREVSVHFNMFNDPFEDVLGNGTNNNWQQICAEKVGPAVARDFWAWYKIISQVKVQEILTTGIIKGIQVKGADGKVVDDRMVQFAAIYALATTLNTEGVKKTHKGLDVIFDKSNPNGIHPEMRVALTIQLSRDARGDIAKHFPKAANELMALITPFASVLAPPPKRLAK